MNLNDISLFIRIVETGSFTAAADSLGVQKSTISRRIAQLEDDLNIRLLQRTTRKLTLTQDGEELFARCQPLINELETARDHLASAQDNPKGRLRITMPSELAVFMMNDMIGSFLRRYPSIHLEVELSTRVVDLVEEGVDLAIRVGELADSSLIARHLTRVNRSLYATPAYLAARGIPQTPADLAGHACYGTLKPMEYWHFENWPEPVEVTGQLKANSTNFIREIIQQDMGIGRLPRMFCQDAVREGRLVEVLPAFKSPPFDVNALYPSRRHLNPKVRLFIDHMMEMIDKTSWISESLVTTTKQG